MAADSNADLDTEESSGERCPCGNIVSTTDDTVLLPEWCRRGDDVTIDERTLRALLEYMTVIEDSDDAYRVVSESGSEYRVDLTERTCSCPDHQHRGVACKHLRRVEFMTGDVPYTAVRARLRSGTEQRQSEIERLEQAIHDLETTIHAYERALERLDTLKTNTT